MGADAGRNGVDVGILAPDSHLGAGTGLAADGLDLNGAAIDLGHFQLEQALDQARVGAADHHAGTALAADHVHNVDLQGLALGVGLAGHLLVAGQDGLAALAQVQGHNALLVVHTGNGGLDDIMGAGLDLAQLLAALGFPDALTDDMLCGLCGNAAEVLGLEGGDNAVADLIALADLLGLGDADLGVLIVPVLIGDNVLHQSDVELAAVGVDLHQNVVVLDLIVLLDSDHDGSLDLLDQVLCGDAALMLQHGESFKKIIVRCSHFSGSS